MVFLVVGFRGNEFRVRVGSKGGVGFMEKSVSGVNDRVGWYCV